MKTLNFLLSILTNTRSFLDSVQDTWTFYFTFKQCVPEACKYFRSKYKDHTVCVTIFTGLSLNRIWISDRSVEEYKILRGCGFQVA